MGGSHYKIYYPAVPEILTVPDLPGCMSDGETPEEAIANVQDAIAAWIEAAHDLGRPVPGPSCDLAIA